MKRTILRWIVMVILGVLGALNGLKAQNTEGVDVGKLPQLPPVVLKRLWDSCTLVDYTFLTLPFSMSLDEKESIQQALRHIGAGPLPLQPSCKPFARVFYQIKGTIVMRADMFFSDDCTYCVYFFHGKPLFANVISKEGLTFFNTIIENQRKSVRD